MQLADEKAGNAGDLLGRYLTAAGSDYARMARNGNPGISGPADFPGRMPQKICNFPGGLSRAALASSGVGSGNRSLLKLYEIQEEVAKRIAHRLHDESAQMLAVVYLELAEIALEFNDAIGQKISVVVKNLDDVCEQLRRLSHELRPLILDQLGLMAGLQFLADGVRKRSSLGLIVTGVMNAPLAKSIETALYRVVQEALSNVVRHSRASVAKVSLWEENGLIHCTVADNGIGFMMPDADVETLDGLGLIGIYERVTALGGECRIYSSLGSGTKLQVDIPR